ncbi:ACP S-malonyltransferase [Kiloniella laminariae]|uniref:Malonyl CoA-acyl carrier protein transacylase n=1 Tax=Kiloniella laminariae TaxID=454162 RepID=A0ABT4LH17_9PROT|nr:ACP S-malonyltransferase [Kiloniella laminariae]MCZ4280402.1 ACP S-malonyltransferase [Kiloniella laminariae]
MKRAFVFPGQGSQVVGMGKELAEAYPVARQVFEEVDDALGQKLSQLMFEGPEGDLTLTENAQPALMAVSMAVVRVLQSEGNFSLSDHGICVAGHSLGEYSALAAVGALELSDAARLLKLRGQSMQQAVPVGQGAMAALLGLDFEEAEAVAKEAAQGEVCSAANDNAPGQVVISGHRGAIERALDIAKEKGAKRALLLPVSAPFHCSLMAPAADVMAEALAGVTLRAPSLPVISNIAVDFVSDPEAIRNFLVQQVTGVVRWRESVLFMKEQGVEQLVELGAGKVLSGLVRRIDKELESENAGTPAEIEELLKVL